MYLWSRGEELITLRFPELTQHAYALPFDAVLDGEIVVWRDGAVQPFVELQRRIGRTKLSAKMLTDIPVRFLAYDLLELRGRDLRGLVLRERREALEQLQAETRTTFQLSPCVASEKWQDPARLAR